jgi:predicted transcriptional regulator
MNQLEKNTLIEEAILDQELFFQSLFLEACNKHLLTDSQIERIQLELVDLMAGEVERYTNDESSSIPVEKAQEILQSVTYCIGVYLKTITGISNKIELMKEEKVSVLFHKGMDTVSEIIDKSKLLLKNLKGTRVPLNNYAYQDTISFGISKFFHDYNIEFGAHLYQGDIDYPLCIDITGLLGAEYIYEYLHRLTMENEFVMHFSKDLIELLFMGFDKGSEHMLFNIFELVFTNALGCVLADQDIKQLEVPARDSRWLQTSLASLNNAELKEKLIEAFNQICGEIILSEDTICYMKSAIPQIAARLYHNLKTGTLDKIFISFGDDTDKEELLEPGVPMEDDKLRDLIEEIRECNLTLDKVEVIRVHVRSILDLIEILEECFYGDEYQEVFGLLGKTERYVLKKYMIKEAGLKNETDFQPEKEWQNILLNYLE